MNVEILVEATRRRLVKYMDSTKHWGVHWTKARKAPPISTSKTAVERSLGPITSGKHLINNSTPALPRRSTGTSSMRYHLLPSHPESDAPTVEFFKPKKVLCFQRDPQESKVEDRGRCGTFSQSLRIWCRICHVFRSEFRATKQYWFYQPNVNWSRTVDGRTTYQRLIDCVRREVPHDI